MTILKFKYIPLMEVKHRTFQKYIKSNNNLYVIHFSSRFLSLKEQFSSSQGRLKMPPQGQFPSPQALIATIENDAM